MNENGGTNFVGVDDTVTTTSAAISLPTSESVTQVRPILYSLSVCLLFLNSSERAKSNKLKLSGFISLELQIVLG